MKKKLLLLGAATALTASAINPGKPLSGEIYIIPEQFLYDGDMIASVIDEQVIKVYNGSLENIATITVAAPQKSEKYATVLGYTALSFNLGDASPVSQTFFNDDTKFEYVVPKVNKGVNQWGKEDLLTTGYSVMSQDGSKLYDIDIPAEYQDSYRYSGSLHTFILDGKKYIVITKETYYTDDHSVYDNLFYEIDPKGGIKAPVIIKGSMKASPATPRHGETVNIDLGSEADGVTTVSVVSANGSTVRSLPVAAGQRNVSLPTAGLASGLYIVTANGREAAKIIIR